jgi:hypothetical protein
VIYSGVTKSDIPELVDALAAGTVVEHLVLNPDTAAERTRHGFYLAAVDPEPTLPVQDFTLLAATHGFDDAWIGEQARRGFIARKPGVDGGPETITVTSKARTRYAV